MKRMRIIDGIEFAEKDYEIDPRIEQRLSSGRQLRDGMMVLIDSPWHRADLNAIDDDVSEYNVAMWNNRWAEASDVKIEKDRVFFTANYLDGSFTRKHHMIKLPWLVKKENFVEENLMPHHAIMQDWYNIAQRAIEGAFDGLGIKDDKLLMSSERIAQLGAKTALDATLPYILEEMKGEDPVRMLTESHSYVPKYFEMDPNTDDVIPTGEDLAIGMVVLTELNDKRIDIERAVGSMSDSEIQLMRKWNRWGKIVSHPGLTEDNEVYFIVEYDDGTKKQIRMNKYQAWYVKKDSMPVEPKVVSGYVTYVNEDGETQRLTYEDFMDLYSEVQSGGLQDPTAEAESPSVYTADPDKVDLVAQPYFDVPDDDGKTPEWVKATEASWNRVKGTTTNP